MRQAAFAVGVLAVACFTAAPVLAGQHGHGAAHAPTPHTTKAPVTHGPVTHGPAAHTSGAPKVKGSPAVKGSSMAKGSPAGKGLSAKKTGATTTTAPATTASTTGTAGTTTAPTSVDFTAGPVGQRLSKNTALTSKLESRLAALGYEGTVYQAGYGFKNLGQFVAATNVSQNLGIPFDQLKLQMTGLSVAADGTVLAANRAPDGSVVLVDPSAVTDPAPTRSLGQAIHSVDTTVDSTAAAASATTEANAEIGR